MIDLFNHALRLHADPSRVVVRPFHLAWAGNGQSRTERLVAAVLAMSREDTRHQLEAVLKDFEARHWQTRRVFMTRYDEIAEMLALDDAEIGDEKRQLIGAYFCHEYSYAAAALMNPSPVPHFDQTGMPPGSLRILMSLRAVGEGHISSVAFREGIITTDNQLKLAPEPPFATAANPVGLDEERAAGGAGDGVAPPRFDAVGDSHVPDHRCSVEGAGGFAPGAVHARRRRGRVARHLHRL